MDLLDMRTLILSYAIVDIACLIVVVSFWWQTRGRFAGIIFFVFDFVFQTSALLLIILRGQIPDWMSYVLASGMVVGGALLGYIGLERFLDRKGSQIHNYILLIVFVFVHAYFTYVQPDQAARNLNASVGLLLICFQCVWLVFRKVKHSMRQLAESVGIIFGLYCVVNLVRIVEYFIGTQRISDYLQSGTFDKIALIANEILFIFLTYALALMFNKRLLLDTLGQEEKYSKVFHMSPYAMMLSRLSDGRIIEANEGHMNMTGYNNMDIRGKTTIDLHLWAREEDRVLMIDELTNKGRVQEREVQFQTKTGDVLTGLFSAEVITINNVDYIISGVNNISERKRMESQRVAALDALRESEERYRLLVENASEGIYVEQDGIVKFTNRSGVETSGYSEKELTSKPFIEFIHADDRELVKERWLNRFKDKDLETRLKFRFLTRSGGIKWLELTAALINFDGKPATLNVVTDITDRKQVEEEIRHLNVELEQKVAERTRALRDSQLALLNLVDDLNQSAKDLIGVNKALEAVNKELASFSYSVSHDLRAPLRSIDGFGLALLEDCADKLDDDGKKYLERIRQATQHMGRLIDDMLNLSRVTQSEFNLEEVDLSKMVHEITNANLWVCSLDGSVFSVQEDIIVRGDQRLMHIALTNLLDNAWKFSGKVSHPHIEFGAILKESKRVIFVRDNGVGFDMSYANKLFGTFQRLHSSHEFPGTGVGLATVLRIINRHGGQIWAESEPGKGATFFFTLPEK